MSPQDVIPMRIGLAPAAGPRPPYDGPSLILAADGTPVSAAPPATPALVGVTGETLNSLTWPDYLAWRKTKTRPYDYVNHPALATTVPEPITVTDEQAARATPDQTARRRALEEIDQATLEMIGEVAELGELFTENGPCCFFGTLRDKLIDECGDILFTASWAFDAWGSNPLSTSDDLELLRFTDDNELVAYAKVIAGNPIGVVLGNAKFVSLLGGLVYGLLITAQTNAGLTANSLKKLAYQRRAQDVEKQIGRIANVLIVVNQILTIANSSVEEALKVNMRKLDARRPNGYDPSTPGGIRTGAGA